MFDKTMIGAGLYKRTKMLNVDVQNEKNPYKVPKMFVYKIRHLLLEKHYSLFRILRRFY